ncbi:MAG: Fe-S cluster assembly protein SufD [Prochlorotrichaceae cyanobacterium]|jgi:Fe-S cluster assembly protein SufD
MTIVSSGLTTDSTTGPGTPSSADQRSQYLQNLLTIAQSGPDLGQVAPVAQVESSALQTLQGQAAARLRELAIPSTREEDWRFTDLSGILSLELKHPYPHCLLPSRAELLPILLPDAPHRLVFVNGIFAPELSHLEDLPPGVKVGNAQSETAQAAWTTRVGQLPGSEEVFTTLNTAAFEDIAVIQVAKDTVLDVPLHLIFVSTSGSQPTFSQPRCLIVADRFSQLSIVEDYITIGEGCMYGSANGVYVTNAVTEIWLGENACIHHSRLQRDSSGAYHIGKTAVHQSQNSRYTNISLLLGAKLSRHNLEVFHQGEQVDTQLHGLALVTGTQIADTHSSIVYQYPHCSSDQLYKAIVDDRGRSIFNGRVYVPQAAQLTNAAQLNRNLLLSSKARVDTKPQLEIVADNVKCAHGATVSQLEDDEIFYLQSRGINRQSAKNLLLDAFAREIINKVPLTSLRETLARCMACRLIL